MAVSLSALAPISIPKNNSTDSETRVRVSVLRQPIVNPIHVKLYGKSCSRSIRGSFTRLNAGFHEIEPDIDEDPTDRWETRTVGPEDFEYGEWDGHHTYFEGEDKRTMWEALSEEYAACEPPTGFQGIMSWLFLPAIAAGMYFNAPGEYLFIGAGLFTIIFCVIEMDKPAKPHNFEPHIYNMERGARDKLIDDFNTLTVWEFNDKYGDLWDVTLKTDDIMKR